MFAGKSSNSIISPIDNARAQKHEVFVLTDFPQDELENVQENVSRKQQRRRNAIFITCINGYGNFIEIRCKDYDCSMSVPKNIPILLLPATTRQYCRHRSNFIVFLYPTQKPAKRKGRFLGKYLNSIISEKD